MAPGRLTLATGGEIPMVGLGTFRSRGEDVRRAVGWALAMGIRHIDTASIYKVRPAIPFVCAAKGEGEDSGAIARRRNPAPVAPLGWVCPPRMLCLFFDHSFFLLASAGCRVEKGADECTGLTVTFWDSWVRVISAGCLWAPL
eukprot:evm.model.scf_4861.1 EVM.evm.TU.scf_4861.1   scf_4861:3283-3711(+)